MHSEWKVTSNPINGKTMYAVYRIIDVNRTDHSGNREYAVGYVSNRETAAIVAAELNKNMEETMKLTKEQETKLTEMAFAEKSNKEIAEALEIELKDVHAARSRLGVTIPKVKAAKGVQPVVDQKAKRTESEVREEIVKVEKAHAYAVKKTERCEQRLGELYKELLETQHGEY